MLGAGRCLAIGLLLGFARLLGPSLGLVVGVLLRRSRTLCGRGSGTRRRTGSRGRSPGRVHGNRSLGGRGLGRIGCGRGWLGGRGFGRGNRSCGGHRGGRRRGRGVLTSLTAGHGQEGDGEQEWG